MPDETENGTDPIAQESELPTPKVSDLWDAATQVATVDQFKTWIRDEVRSLLPHCSLACGYGRVHAAGVSMDYVLTIDYPIEHLAAIRNAVGCIDSPLMRRWMETRRPVLFEADHPWPDISPDWITHFCRYGLANAAVHAVYDTGRCVGTYFSFHRLPSPLTQTHRAVLAVIAPLLHETLLRVVAGFNAEPLPGWSELSTREKEIASHVASGSDNSSIARALGISENTVKHHVAHILRKTGQSNRSRLVFLMAGQSSIGDTIVL